MFRPIRTVQVAAGLLIIVSAASVVSAQRGFGFFGFGGVRFAPSEWPDRDFTVCRIMYTSVRREANGGGWRTDYPGGETNLMVRMAELTKVPISRDQTRRPNTWVVRMTD